MQQVYRKTQIRNCNFKKKAFAEHLSRKQLWGNASDVFIRKLSIYYIILSVVPVNCLA